MHMNKFRLFPFAFAILVTGSAFGTSHTSSVPPAASPSAPASGEMIEGEVRKVDLDAKKITLRHGEIKNLEMPSMTMVFQVKDPAMLDKVKTGDKVRFSAEKLNGAITLTSIEAVSR
jgi:Cu/Ag efflux protein CusF